MKSQALDELGELRVQRDELLAACKALLVMIDGGWIPPDGLHWVAEAAWETCCDQYRKALATTDARAAIEKAEKGAE